MTESAWTDGEIKNGQAFRERHGMIIAIEICGGCLNGFPKGAGKLGYGRGRPLCRNCWVLERQDEKHDQDEAVLGVMGAGHWMLATLAKTCRLTQAATEQALHNLATAGRVARRGRTWIRTEDRQ